MTELTIPAPAAAALRSASFALEKIHATVTEASEALAPLPLLDSAKGDTYRQGVLAAGACVARLAMLGVELAILLGRLQAAGEEAGGG